MKKTINWGIGFMALFMMMCFTSVQANAQSPYKDGQKVTITGEVLDMHCYISGEKSGEDHAQCAKMCVMGGAPMGILDSDGNVFLVAESHDSADAYNGLKDYGAEQVSVTGIYYNRGGVNGIVIQSFTPKEK